MTWNNKLIYIVYLVGYFRSCHLRPLNGLCISDITVNSFVVLFNFCHYMPVLCFHFAEYKNIH